MFSHSARSPKWLPSKLSFWGDKDTVSAGQVGSASWIYAAASLFAEAACFLGVSFRWIWDASHLLRPCRLLNGLAKARRRRRLRWAWPCVLCVLLFWNVCMSGGARVCVTRGVGSDVILQCQWLVLSNTGSFLRLAD